LLLADLEKKKTERAAAGERKKRAVPTDCAVYLTRTTNLTELISTVPIEEIAANAEQYETEATELSQATFSGSECDADALTSAAESVTTAQSSISTIVTAAAEASRALRAEKLSNATALWVIAPADGGPELTRQGIYNLSVLTTAIGTVVTGMLTLSPDSGDGIECVPAQLAVENTIEFCSNNTLVQLAADPTAVTSYGATMAGYTKPTEGCKLQPADINDIIVTKLAEAVTAQKQTIYDAEMVREPPRTPQEIYDLSVIFNEELPSVIAKATELSTHPSSARRKRAVPVNCAEYNTQLLEYIYQLDTSSLDTINANKASLGVMAETLSQTAITEDLCTSTDLTTTIGSAQAAKSAVEAILTVAITRASDMRAINVHNRTTLWSAEEIMPRLEIPKIDAITVALTKAMDKIVVIKTPITRRKRAIGDTCATSQLKIDVLTDTIASKSLTELVAALNDIQTFTDDLDNTEISDPVCTAFDKTHLQSEFDALVIVYTAQLDAEKLTRRVRSDTDKNMVDTVRMPPRFGTEPVDGDYTNALACDCGMVMSAIRKDVKATLTIDDDDGDVTDITSVAFKKAKVAIEDIVSRCDFEVIDTF
jgi:hypothetical protein